MPSRAPQIGPRKLPISALAIALVALLVSLIVLGIQNHALIIDLKKCTAPARHPDSCTLKSIAEETKANGYFPTAGVWRKVEYGYPFAQFLPQNCDLAHPALAPSITRDFMEEAKPRSVIIVGDSQGRQFRDALKTLLVYAGYWCRTVKEESIIHTSDGYTIDTQSYYTQDLDNPVEDGLLKIHRTCDNCPGRLLSCHNRETEHQVNVEYIPMILLSNNSITVNQTYCKQKGNSSHPICSIKTQQDFLFRIYLKNKFPDVLMLFSTFAHYKRHSIEGAARGYNYLFNILRETANNDSKVLMFSSTKMNLDKLPKHEIGKTYENGLDVNGLISALNHVLYKAMKQEEQYNKTRMYGFWDLFAMTNHNAIAREWYEDHVHFKEDWYRTVMAYVMELLAAEQGIYY